MTNTITCPNCGTQVTIDQAMADQVAKAKKALENEYAQKYKAQEADLETQKKKLETERKSMETEINQKVETEKKKMWAIAQKKAAEKVEEKFALEMKDLREQAKEKDEQLKKAQAQELELRKKTRELAEKEKNMELELQRKLDEESKKIEAKAKESLDEVYKKKIGEKDQQMEQMRKTIEELKRRSEQGSMQIQGDAQENDLKSALAQNFPYDSIEDVPTGIKGADLVQKVRNQFGQKSGIILWESKNTKQWNNAWIKKLKDDQAEAKADLCIIATTTMPDDIKNFGFRDGVWIAEYRFVLPLAHALRFHLLEVTKVHNSVEGRDEKMEFLYQYLSGPQFKNKIENIVSAFTGMKDDLESEKRAMQRIWNKREKEIERVIHNTAGLYGDMQGIIALPNIQSLELPSGEEGTLF